MYAYIILEIHSKSLDSTYACGEYQNLV